MNGLTYTGLACACLMLGGFASAATATQKNKLNTKPDCVIARGKAPIKIESRCMRLELGSVIRTYRLYKPKVLPKSSLSLLVALHGGGGSGSNMEGITLGQLNRIADKDGVIVVYPDGVDRTWNADRVDPLPNTNPPSTTVNDVEFLRVLVARIAAQYTINPRRIYATGISNGGLMAFRLACDAADVFTAVAPVAANFAVELARDCKPARMISIAMISGTDDPIMPWLGGDVTALGIPHGEVLSTQDSFEHWTEFGDCAIPTTHMQRDSVRDDGTSLVRHVARECNNKSEMRLYEIIGGGHTWPGGYAYSGKPSVGKVSRELNASEEIWRFFAERGR